MLRSTLMTILSAIPVAMALQPAINAVPLYAQAMPRTVQVERGGAEIYTQPESSAQVIGTYRAGVILTPRLKLFNPEGQAWLKIGDHWIAEESIVVLEDSPKTATPTVSIPPNARPTPVTIPTPVGGTPPTPTPSAKPSPAAVKPQPQAKPAAEPQPAAKPKPAAKQPQTQAKGTSSAVLVTKDPEAQVNVRTEATTQSDVIHAGNPGDSAQILKRQVGENGFTWYLLKFPKAKVQGWVRGDFIKR